ncbi:MAG: hypothetical protein WCN98_17770 [Verrucomicrobiaceae bacterium]
MSARTEFVTNNKGQRVAVLLDVKTYSRLMDASEELADIRAYDKAKPHVTAELKRGQFVTLSQHLKKKVLGAR